MSKDWQSLLASVAILLFLSWLNHSTALIVIASTIVLFGLVSPYFRTQWTWLGDAIGRPMSRFNSGLILSVLFFLVLTPLARLKKLFSGSNSFSPGTKDSYFVDRNHRFTKDDLRDPW